MSREYIKRQQVVQKVCSYFRDKPLEKTVPGWSAEPEPRVSSNKPAQWLQNAILNYTLHLLGIHT